MFVGANAKGCIMRRELRRWLDENLPADSEKLLEPVMTIGEAARSTGLSESALRKYENAGLILYHRSSGNVRVLSHEDIHRIKWIQHLIKENGLNLEGIRRLWALLPCWECKGCDHLQLEACSAIHSKNRPCWAVFKEKDAGNAEKCRTCDVYRMAGKCTEHLKFLVHNSSRPHLHLSSDDMQD